jgi:cell division transport system ATP-binding protein
MNQTKPLVSIQNLSVYQRGNLVLSQVNIAINKGEFVYLIGKTGSGKSSLMQMLYAGLPIKEGEIEFAESKISTLSEKEIPFLRRKLGIVFQDFQLLTDRNIQENLFFVMKATGWTDKNQMLSRVKEVLEKVGLGTKGMMMPFQLSGGEQQRLAIARALVNHPLMVIADEPTGNLDPSTSEEIVALLKEISAGGTTVLMATHDYSLFKKFPSRTLSCESGKVQDSASISSL